jgi:hypothetical protein
MKLSDKLFLNSLAAMTVLPPSCKKWKKWRVRVLWAHKEKGMWNGTHWVEVMSHEIDQSHDPFRYDSESTNLVSCLPSNCELGLPSATDANSENNPREIVKFRLHFVTVTFMLNGAPSNFECEIKPNYHKTYRPARAPCNNSPILASTVERNLSLFTGETHNLLTS